MSSYNLRGNTAQMDEKAVKLVCAAALAGGGSRPLLVVLDELGRNLQYAAGRGEALACRRCEPGVLEYTMPVVLATQFTLYGFTG